MKITFIGARRVNPGRDGFDFLYFYTIDEDTTTHKIHVVTLSDRSELAWNISEPDLYEYSKRVFALVIDFIKSHWYRYHELPDENREYYEPDELGKLSSTKENWENYVLELE